MIGVQQVEPELMRHVETVKSRYAPWVQRAAEVREVRAGNFDKIAPGAFNVDWPRPIVANMISAIAQHAQAALSPLPTITCTSPTMTSDAARKSAEKRTRIANHYYKNSDVASQRQTAADQFYTYGLMVASVEPDWEARAPIVVYEDAIGTYPEWDRFGRTRAVTREFMRHVWELKVEYPNLIPAFENAHIGVRGTADEAIVRVIKHENANRIVMYLPDLGGAVLVDMPNPMGKCTYVVTKKPGLEAKDIAGSFDDLIWVQIARHFMQMLALEAAADAVEAPLVVPNDVGDIPMGANAVIRTQNPGGVGRVKLDVPPSVWASIEHLKNEMQYGAISPQALGGSIDASVVTGRGVQELMAGYSQQVAMCQDTIVRHDEQVIALCFEMDEKFWPDVKKEITGRLDGAQYRLEYTPTKDIAGDYSADVVYGGVKGLDPNRGLVYVLQELGAGIVSKDWVRRTVDADINPAEEESKIALEQMRDTLIQAMSAYGQSLPNLVAQGQDPSEIISRIVAVNRGLQKNKSLETILEEVFAPPEPPPEAPLSPEQMLAEQMGQPAAMGGEVFQPSPGAPATAGPGGRPDLQTFFAGMTGAGAPSLAAGVSRMQPVA